MQKQWTQKLRGVDSLEQRALPIGEFFHPLSLLCVVILLINDWYLKPSAWAPSIITGKLSDFAGLLFFPLLLTSLVDSFLLALSRLGVAVDFTLRPKKVALAIAATAIVFAAMKLNVSAHDIGLDALGALGLNAKMVMDPSDLIALLALLVTWKIGISEIARMPLGRIELILNRHKRYGKTSATSLEDVADTCSTPRHHRQLVETMDRYLKMPSSQTACELGQAVNTMRKLHGGFDSQVDS